MQEWAKKGVDLLINAYISVLDNLPSGSNLPKMVVAGPGLDTAFGKKILQTAARHHDHIKFVGMLTGDTKWGALYGCQAFILPSHQENFGIAVAEALACGKPVLISNQVNIWQQVETVKAGLIAPDTLEGITKLIRNWNEMPADIQYATGKNARVCFEKHFDSKVASQDFLTAIKSRAILVEPQ